MTFPPIAYEAISYISMYGASIMPRQRPSAFTIDPTHAHRFANKTYIGSTLSVLSENSEIIKFPLNNLREFIMRI